ncbi:hypothetical protein ACEPAF_9698 [Sanghuangporus sanghuang]
MARGLFGNLKGIDAFGKTAEDVKVKTKTGAFLTLLSAAIILAFTTIEFLDYRRVNLETSIVVDKSRGEKLTVRMNVTFPKVPCYLLSLDVMDISGETQRDLSHNIVKTRLGASGVPIPDSQSAELRNKLDVMNDQTKENYCGSCYGGVTPASGCCNTCEEVRQAYVNKGWSFSNPDSIEQCVREHWSDKLKEQANEGCNISGRLRVNKVIGNIHLSPGRSFQTNFMNIHELVPYLKDDQSAHDFGHTIHQLSFEGDDEYNFKKKEKSMDMKKKLGIVGNPLDGASGKAPHVQYMFQYFLKVVSTKFELLDGQTVKTHQYSTTHFERDLTQGAMGQTKDGVHVSHTNAGMPGVFINYEISPLLVVHSETRQSFAHFLTSTCAIVGGVLTIATIVDNDQDHCGRNEKDWANVRHETQFCDVGHTRPALLGGEYAINTTPRERRRTRRLHSFIILSLLLVFVHYWRFPAWTPSYVRTDYEAEDGTNFDWSVHPPSKTLNWTDCYYDFQCARLTVPLLYSEPSGEEAAVALIKYPSKYPPGHEKYRGPILFNPGGPGGSGVSTVLSLAKTFQIILSDEFDLVGFDPRGVGSTTPHLSIFNDQVEAGKFFLEFPETLNSSSSSLGEAFARANIAGNIVADRARFVAERVSTPLVARDMLSIVKAFGQDKLQYWGFSYGTILGATFAAMFPNNVGRVIIDGVVDTDDYYNGLWANNLRDTDDALMDIYQSCVNAGPSRCPIYEKSASLVQARVDRLLHRLKSEPIAFYSNSTDLAGGYEVVDYALVKIYMFLVLYNTHRSGLYLANALAALEQGDPSGFYLASPRKELEQLLQCSCPAPGENPARFQGGSEITLSIGCGDILEKRDEELDDIRRAYEEMSGVSGFADVWKIRVLCSGWKLAGKERFNGSFEQSTSHPLLIIGNTADPVTPVWNAHKVSKGFKDSVVLTQNSSGHCSIAATSLCTFRAIQEYFVNGTLPERGTVCEADSSIFGEKELNLDALSVEERELVDASEMLRKNYFIPPLGGGRVPLI